MDDLNSDLILDMAMVIKQAIFFNYIVVVVVVVSPIPIYQSFILMVANV